MSVPKKRTRQIILRDDPVRFSQTANRPGVPSHSLQEGSGRHLVTGAQFTESEGHPWKRKFTGDDLGGPFWTEKEYYRDERGDMHSPGPNFSFSGVNPDLKTFVFTPLFALKPGDGTRPSMPAIKGDNVALEAYGTKAIALTKPTNSHADLLTAFSETLREGIPSLVGREFFEKRAKQVKSAGSEYLNVQFGWLPLVSDIQKSMYAVSNADKVLKQYERDAGRLVRRRYEFPIERTITNPVVISTGAIPFSPVFAYSNTGSNAWRHYVFADYPNHGRTLYKHSETTVKRWFSGAFTYYLPTGYDSRSKVDRYSLFAKEILGIELTPDVLWNLTPWSWLSDWVFNIGDVISNATDYLADGLVLRYGYMMEHTVSKNIFTLPDVHLKGYGKRTLILEHVREVKRRIPASPFGFGITDSSLSAKQLSILAALGISRG